MSASFVLGANENLQWSKLVGIAVTLQKMIKEWTSRPNILILLEVGSMKEVSSRLRRWPRRKMFAVQSNGGGYEQPESGLLSNTKENGAPDSIIR